MNKHTALIPTYLGAALGFLGYLIFGSIPSILYGGYMGLTMHGVLFGESSGWMQQFMVGGGMGLGLIAVLFFFLVFGAVFGTLVGLPFAPLLRKVERENSENATVTAS